MPGFWYPYHYTDMVKGEIELVDSHGEPVKGPNPLKAAVPFLEDRDRALEDYLSTLASGLIVFNFPGPLVVTFSDQYYPPNLTTFRRFVGSLTNPGTSNTVVNVYRNATVVDTITLGNGVRYLSTKAAQTFSEGVDFLQFYVAQVGAGAGGLVCQAVP